MSHAYDVAVMPVAVVIDPPAGDRESELVERARQRDVRAFELLYRRHVARIYALCLRMTADAPRAEEATQTAFIGAWEKLPGFRGESAFASWLHRLAVNVVLMELRATWRREQRVCGTDDLSLVEASVLAAEPPPTAPGTRLDLEQAIAALPTQARIVFVLHAIEGWRHEEIAAHLGVTAGTTKAQLHRARQKLQEALR